MGIDVKGKIVLVRYGSLFRGLKVRNAQKRGADRHPDLLRPGRRWIRQGRRLSQRAISTRARPFSAAVSSSSRWDRAIRRRRLVRRSRERSGCPIDPKARRLSNSGVRSIEWEKTTGLKRDDYFATIPSLPISYDTAHEILKVLAGANVPVGLARRAAPAVPRRARSRRKFDCRSAMDYQLRTIWNVIATIPGTVEPDRWVMIGNHRDAWVYGAVDPGSGTAATLEMCRALGAAVKNGWKPRRTLLYASWDAEEYGLVGSTEWAEQNADVDQRKGRAHAQRRLGGQRAGARDERRAVAARPGARRRRCDHRPANGQVAPRGLDRCAPRSLGGQCAARPRRPDLGLDRRGRCSIASRTPPCPVGFFPQMGSLGSGSDLHGVRRPSGSSGHRRRLQGRIWGVSLDLRRFQLDGEVRRPRVLDARHGGPALYLDRDAQPRPPTSCRSSSSPTAWPCANTSTSFD